MDDALGKLAGLLCCGAGGVLVLAAIANLAIRRRAAPTVAARPDVNVELGLSLVGAMQASDTTPSGERAAILRRAHAAARSGDMGALLAAADQWTAAGGVPANRGQFNDLRRAVDAVAAG